jgi:hypothetical protein
MMSTDHDQTLDLVSNNRICEAAGCFQKATIEKEEKAGQGKKIMLSLCKYCAKKFRDK